MGLKQITGGLALMPVKKLKGARLRTPSALTVETNAMGKKWEHLRAALALHFAYYNFCKWHNTIRATPAMAAGIADRVWNLGELLS